jgi:hypothetical protein
VRSAPKAAAIAQYTRLRQNDQIIDGILRYERDRQRSLEFTQVCIASWVNIAIMCSKFRTPALDMWFNGLGQGHSVKVSAFCCTSHASAAGQLVTWFGCLRTACHRSIACRKLDHSLGFFWHGYSRVHFC